MFDILKSAHQIIENSPTLKSIHNPKTLCDNLVRSRLRAYYEEERGVFICGIKNCDICNILEPGNEFKSTTTEEVYKLNFNFHCSSESVVYLLTCKIVGNSMLDKP